MTEVRLMAQLYETRLRRPDLPFMDVSTHDNVAEEELLEIHQRIKELLGRKRSAAPSLPNSMG